MATERKIRRRTHPLPEMERVCAVSAVLTIGQYADLRLIADRWGVGSATAAYAILADFIAEIRHESLKFSTGSRAQIEVQAAIRLFAGMQRENVLLDEESES